MFDLVSTIQNSPEDTTSQLIYADWLDERGDPRGELIRLLVEVRETVNAHPNWKPFLASLKRNFGTTHVTTLIDRLDERQQRLFACQCAESVLSIFEENYPDDQRPRKAIETARKYACGNATKKELETAYAYASSASAYAYTSSASAYASAYASAAAYAYTSSASAYASAYTSSASAAASAAASAHAYAYAYVSSADWACDLETSRAHQQTWLVERLLKFRIY